MMNSGRQTSYIIGADIGTGSAKALAIDGEAKILYDSQFYYNTQSPQTGYAEQDPEIIWKAFSNCIQHIIEQMGYTPLSISLSSAMHSIMAVDENHLPLTPLITWADTRAGKIALLLRNSDGAKKLYEATGTPIHSMSPLCKIIWLKENEPTIFKKAFKFISIKEYIWFQLFNDYQIDYSIASASGLFNIHNLDWHTGSLQLCNLQPDRLSMPVPTTLLRKGAVNSNSFQIDEKTYFCIGASDGCLANVGSNSMQRGTASVTIGTSGAVRIATKKPVLDFKTMPFNYLLDEETFISGGPVNNGGNIVPWLFNTFLQISSPQSNDYDQLFALVKTIPAGSNGLIFLPYLFGERAPIWDEASSAVYCGMKPWHTNGHLIRAALEGICFSLKAILNNLEQSTEKIDELHVSGGFIHSPVWIQILADVTGKKVRIVSLEDASSLGAALLNLKSLKIINNYTGVIHASNEAIEPDIAIHKLYEKYFAIFNSLYRPLMHPMHELYHINQPLG
jgi:gluconokinase